MSGIGSANFFGPWRLFLAFALALGLHAAVLFGWSTSVWEAPLADSIPGDAGTEVELVDFAPGAEEDTPAESGEEPEPPPPETVVPKTFVETEAIPVSTPAPEVDETPPVPETTPEPAAQATPEIQATPEPARAPRASVQEKPRKASPAKTKASGSAKALAATGRQGSPTGRKSGGPTDSQPGYLRNPHPAYPEEARRAGVEGVVTLRVSVGKTGRVTGARIECSCGHASLDRRALETVRSRWVFRPARLNGEAVEADVLVPVRFSLK